MSESDVPDAPDEDEVSDPTVVEEPPAAVEPLLSLDDFAMLENLPRHVLAALRRFTRVTARATYATASQWQDTLRALRAYVPR